MLMCRHASFHAHERRLDLDKQPLTRTEFARKYGGIEEWDAAAGRNYIELRCAPNGEPYTAREFEDLFGGSVSDRDGEAYRFWDSAKHAAHKLTKGLNEHRRIEELLDTHASYQHGMDDIHLATCWFRIGSSAKRRSPEARWLRQNRGRLSALRAHTLAMMPLFEARGLSNISHGLASASLDDGELFDAVATAATPRLRDFKPQELANTAWAFATAKHAAPEFFDALAAAATPRLRDFDTQAFANTAWAFKTMGRDVETFRAEFTRRGGIDAFRDEKHRAQLAAAFPDLAGGGAGDAPRSRARSSKKRAPRGKPPPKG